MRSRRLEAKQILRWAVCGLGVASPAAWADAFTWDADAGTDTNWSTASNWLGDSLPASGSDVTFAAAGDTATIDTTSQAVGSITFDRAGGFTLNATGGADLTINTGVAAGAAAYSISAPLVLGSDGTWSVAADGSLTASGDISGTAGLTKTGGGTLALLGNTTYTGPTHVAAGTLVVNQIAAGSLTLNGGALRYVGAGHSYDRTFALGTAGGTIEASGTGPLSLQYWSEHVLSDGSIGGPTLTLAGESTADNVFGISLNDLGGGETVLRKTGPGKWIIPATVPDQPTSPYEPFGNAHSGGTQISGGTLEIQADVFFDGVNTYVTGGLMGVDVGVVKNKYGWSGVGTASVATDPGKIILDGGALVYRYVGVADDVNDTDPNLRRRAHDVGQVARRFTLGVGSGTIEVSGNGPLNLFNNQPLTMDGEGTRTLCLTGDFADTAEGTNHYNALAARIGDAGGPTSFVKDGPGEWVLTGTSTYTGSTTINAGTLLLAHANNGTTSTYTNVLPETTTLTIAAAGELELYTGDSGSVIGGGASHDFEPLAQTIASLAGSGKISLNAGTLIVANAAASLYSGAVRDTQPDGSYLHQTGGNLIKQGGGTLALTGALTYTGLTYVDAGTLEVMRLAPGTLSISTSATARVLPKNIPNDPVGTSVVKSLTIAAGGQLDLTSNSMVIDYTGSPGTLEDELRQHLLSGRLTGTATGGTKIGYADNAVLATTSFGGVAVDTDSMLIKFTYAGDTNLDGQVTIADLGDLASNWQSTTAFWRNGDFNYDGAVTISDLGDLATNWQAGVGNPLGMSFNEALAAVGLGGALVPEPAMVGLLGLLGTCTLKRARRV